MMHRIRYGPRSIPIVLILIFVSTGSNLAGHSDAALPDQGGPFGCTIVMDLAEELQKGRQRIELAALFGLDAGLGNIP
jgi:hypothetical protein